MTFEKTILAVLTTSSTVEIESTHLFKFKSSSEMDDFAANLEAILDGIAHKLNEEVYIIVRH
ncbi:MAG: hypothetical protein K0R71_296 [Bacillales bacterium]|jgi:hypothetical protein|nr:hypothetical protein [Bacillales bacterium]